MKKTWRICKRGLTNALLGIGVLAASAPAWSAAGAPLPLCPAGSLSFYQARYLKSGTDASNIPPTIALDQVTLPTAAGGAATITNIWTGQSAPTPPGSGTPPAASVNAGATVAMGMNPQNGYIYAIRATQGDPDYSNVPVNSYKQYTGHIQVLKYGTTGVDNLGAIANMPDGTGGLTDRWFQLGPNYNAAAFNPANNELIIGNLQSGGARGELIRISVGNDVPTYLGKIPLVDANGTATQILSQSGDFAIDATGTYAYGIATASGGASNTSYRIELATGIVTNLVKGVGENVVSVVWGPYGAAARLQNGQMAFVGGLSTATPGVRLMDIPAGTVSGPANYTTTNTAQSLDATECLPVLPVVTLTCDPATLVDAASNVATCTITSDTAAPTGGLSVALTLPASNPRYTTTCESPIVIDAGQTTKQCTITAVENTVPGDGSVTATLALATPAAGAAYTLGTPTSADVTVNNDDAYVANLTCTPTTLVDAPNNVSTCTLTLNGPAPTGGLDGRHHAAGGQHPLHHHLRHVVDGAPRADHRHVHHHCHTQHDAGRRQCTGRGEDQPG
ncbi:hypothetical protein [Ottowia sp. SB7-C50]|uniref:hypothetical protein n=1 Tax=Ottowia sp. SB7-C50 TaxID=3081231 RepID=UPI0029551261|nr:hypothetical protein [Ottowia sp. SB7-C50]WOP16528.1 hypothetical protein R0D99_05790 [Ottowia sp. SB7-C50]